MPSNTDGVDQWLPASVVAAVSSEVGNDPSDPATVEPMTPQSTADAQENPFSWPKPSGVARRVQVDPESVVT